MIGIYAQFHNHFPYNENSNWFHPCYVDDIELGKNSIRIDWIFDDIYKYYEREGVSKKDFLKAFGQQSTEYWLLKNTPDLEYIGSATYRRLLNFNLPITLGKNRIEGSEITGVRANVEEAHKANTNEEAEIAKHYLQFVDVITNHSSYLPGSVEDQYLQTQPKEYWNLFQKAILELFPEYKESYKWLWQSKTNFNTVYIFRREYFLKYASRHFKNKILL